MIHGNVGIKLLKVASLLTFVSFNHIILSKYCVNFLFKETKILFILEMVTQFLQSKPPGRKMVTSDVQIYFIMAFQMANFSLYTGIITRLLFGYLPYTLIFFFVEMMKHSLHFGAAVANVSAILEFSIIFNFEWTHKTDDKVLPFIISKILPPFIEYYHIFNSSFHVSMHYFCIIRILPGKLDFPSLNN